MYNMYNKASSKKSQLLTTVYRDLQAVVLLKFLEAGKQNRTWIPANSIKFSLFEEYFRDLPHKI